MKGLMLCEWKLKGEYIFVAIYTLYFYEDTWTNMSRLITLDLEVNLACHHFSSMEAVRRRYLVELEEHGHPDAFPLRRRALAFEKEKRDGKTVSISFAGSAR
jgi:hypothetical protein